jgi:hypothetical protein
MNAVLQVTNVAVTSPAPAPTTSATQDPDSTKDKTADKQEIDPVAAKSAPAKKLYCN